MQSWEDYIKSNILKFRKDYGELPDEAKKIVDESRKIVKYSLNKPCQVAFFDFVEPYPKLFVILHEPKNTDMSIMVFHKTTPNNLSSKASQYQKLLDLIGKKRTETIIERVLLGIEIDESNLDISWYASGDYLPLLDVFFLFFKELVPSTKPSYEFSEMMMKHMMFYINNTIKDNQKKNIEKTVDDLRRDAELIPVNVELRDKIIENTQRLDNQFIQLDEQYKKLRDELLGVRKLVGTKTFGEWKILLSEIDILKTHTDAEIDNMKTRLDALAKIKETYDKVLDQQIMFMKQQADVMKQQSSFINLIKYATILVPTAVLVAPLIDLLLRYLLGIS